MIVKFKFKSTGTINKLSNNSSNKPLNKATSVINTRLSLNRPKIKFSKKNPCRLKKLCTDYSLKMLIISTGRR